MPDTSKIGKDLFIACFLSSGNRYMEKINGQNIAIKI